MDTQKNNDSYKEFNTILNEGRNTVVIGGVTYRVGDVINGDELFDLSGEGIDGEEDCGYRLIRESLSLFRDDGYNREYYEKNEPDFKEIEFDKIESMKRDFDNLPPIPEHGDGLHRIIAAKEMGHRSILMWQKIK